MKKYLSKLKFEISGRLLFHFIYIFAIATLPQIIKLMIDSDFPEGNRDIIYFVMKFIAFIVIGMISQYFFASVCLET